MPCTAELVSGKLLARRRPVLASARVWVLQARCVSRATSTFGGTLPLLR
ncbi:hypothetical protein B0O95_11914 [Mycetohabitans endofungorum]|uniref:Uncharacterized protein n=1 Tax=Mycetohabitans endofungorum TaxID=417203 RepID=A0A2P5K704_9BURK|nr:hypothetical protein B0O95_11914 [Mycetohabitans endofungorum]